MLDIMKKLLAMSGDALGFGKIFGNSWVVGATDGAAATDTATKAAESGKKHILTGFDISVRDDTIAADSYIKVEIEVDGTPIATYNYSWDIDQEGQLKNPHLFYTFPAPIWCTAGLSVGITVTVAAAADLVACNLYGFTED